MKNNQIVFGVNILEHIKSQLNERNLTENQRKDMEKLITHLEAGNSYWEYQG